MVVSETISQSTLLCLYDTACDVDQGFKGVHFTNPLILMNGVGLMAPARPFGFVG